MTLVYMLIQTKHGKIKLVSAALRKFEEIEELHELYGRYDIIAKIKVASPEELRRFVQNKMRLTDNIQRTETLFVSDEETEGAETEEELEEGLTGGM